jgi:hypothetical protein
MLDAGREAIIQEAAAILQREFEDVEILRKNSMIRRREKWYSGPKVADRHWPALKSYLLHKKNWSEDNVRSIDAASSEVVSLLENPLKDEFSCRGLVVGYVQSGKTANMAGVISKAIDAGYDTVIVLAGLTNKLREQTQRRLEQDIVKRNPLLWQKLTRPDENGDFRTPAQGGLLYHSDKAQLAVIKKNVSPLRSLLETIEGTLAVNLKRLRFLIIDDECDQASVNAASGETDMTAINEKIRALLSLLPCASYVGYTATPFANVLINPHADSSGRFDDLYPKDFITALPTPEGYFGAEKLFGKPAAMVDGDAEADDGLDMVREVPESDEALIQPPSMKERESFYPKMPGSLEDAVLYFLACCAVRRARGDEGEHMTMLVHTSAFVNMHNRLADLVRAWIAKNEKDLRARSGAASLRLETIWKSEQGRLPDNITAAKSIGLNEVFEHLPNVLKELETPIENGGSDDRIDYSGSAKTYIVVGGSILARGLTLEGLMVSYFIRNSNQYDTLLQMGRWFGYRRGYEDLPRVWMPVPLQMSFRALAGIELEIRDEIRQYVDQQPLTPMEFAVRIRELPGMAITAANKMRHAEKCDVSWWGQHVQTIRFDHRDPDVVSLNWAAAGELVSPLATLSRERPGRLLFKDVPKTNVLKFLRAYSVHSTHKDLSSKFLVRFLEQNFDALETWNVGIPQTNIGQMSKKSLGSIGPVRLFNRSKLQDTGAVADIKALMSKQDVLFDVEAELSRVGATWRSLKHARQDHLGDRPLLLLYPIDSQSTPKAESKVREKLNAVDDLMGFGIVLPGSEEMAGNHVSVRLDPPDPEELAAMEEEERSSAEAAGVY